MASRHGDRVWPGWRLVAAIVLSLVLGALLLDWAGSNTAPDPLGPSAIDACRDEYIPRQLQVPESASYDLRAEGGPTTYAVTGTVDAETAAGSLAHDEVRCVVTLVGGERWRLESLGP